MTPSIYILLPVYNRRDITLRFVTLLKKQTHEDFHLILIDDGSVDGTADEVSRILPTATVLRGDGNLWWAGSLQLGFNHLASCNLQHNPLVLIINDDVSFASNYLERAKIEMASLQGVLLLSQFVDDKGRSIETGIHADLETLSFNVASSPNQINCLSTRGLFIHWNDIQAIGGFRPKLLPHYLSDYEFTMRAHNIGLKCATSPKVLIKPNLDTTGIRKVLHKTFGAYIRDYFSKRHAMNPLYWTIFVFLTGNLRNIPKNILKIWLNAFRDLLGSTKAQNRCQLP